MGIHLLYGGMRSDVLRIGRIRRRVGRVSWVLGGRTLARHLRVDGVRASCARGVCVGRGRASAGHHARVFFRQVHAAHVWGRVLPGLV